MAEELEVRRSITVQRDAVCGGEGLEFGGGALMAEILRDGGKQILHRHGGAPAAEIRRYLCKVARHEQVRLQSLDRCRLLEKGQRDIGQQVQREAPQKAVYQRRHLAAEQMLRPQDGDDEQTFLQPLSA